MRTLKINTVVVACRVEPGADLAAVLTEAKQLAAGRGAVVAFDFNGVRLSVNPQSDLDTVANYWRSCMAKSTTYRRSWRARVYAFFHGGPRGTDPSRFENASVFHRE